MSNFLLELKELLEGVVEKYDLSCSLMWKLLTDLLEALWPLQQLDNESLDVGNAPNILPLVLHLVVERVLYQLEAREDLDRNCSVRVLIDARLRHTHVAGLRSEVVVGNLRRERPNLWLNRTHK